MSGILSHAMSQQIEDFLRSVYDRFNGGERLPSGDAWHADGVYVNSSNDPDPGTHRGLEAITKQFQIWIEAYPDLRVDPLEIVMAHRVSPRPRSHPARRPITRTGSPTETS